MRCQIVFVGLGLMWTATGCAKVKAAVCGEPPTAAVAKSGTENAKQAKADQAAQAAAADDAAPAEEAHASTKPPAPKAPGEHDQFALPFAWEKSPEEPLSRTRAFLRAMSRDNAVYMRRGPEFFKSLAGNETPRTTLLGCADSRVQSEALDRGPENDLFTVRNLGNQLTPGLGAVQYGVEQLRTPVLLVLGHTGCSAIKAALSGSKGLSEPIRRELATLAVGKHKPAKGQEDKLWRDAVLRNVNDQVEAALETFAARVNAGQLTVIGAVYDLRNELGKGSGKISIVNVNGTTEAARLKAFEDAVLSGAQLEPHAKANDPFERLSQVFAEHLSTQDSEEDEEEEPEAQLVPVAPVQPKPVPLVAPPGATLPAQKAAPPPQPAPAHPAEPAVPH